nr:hypothetical protein [Actinomadura sp. KC06]
MEVPTAYIEDAIPIKRDEAGEMISCISAPSSVATQLEQLGAGPGHKILEAEAATGYDAALLGRLVAPGGHVWTVDVDQDLVDRAQNDLTQAGPSNVRRGIQCHRRAGRRRRRSSRTPRRPDHLARGHPRHARQCTPGLLADNAPARRPP